MRFLLSSALLFIVASCATSDVNKSVLRVEHPPLHLVLGLDGVGFKTFKKLYDGGYFRSFNQPSQMVSSFPSISDPNWARLLGAPLSPGYTKSYFDMSVKTSGGQGQPVGSLITHLTSPPKYEEGFDFKAEGVMQHFAMMTWTETSALYWLDALERQFVETRDRDFFYAFIMNTDIIAHIQGEKPLMEYLVILDKRITRLREEMFKKYGYKLDVTIVSDHGNYFTKPQSINFEETLKKHGWSLVDTLSKKKDVGFVVPEIIAFGSFHCLAGNERDLARDLSESDGVHMTSYISEPNVVHVLSKGGSNETVIKVNPKNMTVQYSIIKGEDPLGQIKYFKDEGELSWKSYFIKSFDSNYPYSVVRIWEGFYKNNTQSSSVLVSPLLGRVFANQTLKMLTMMKGLASTHGSLHREETIGALLSTKDSFPPIRPEDFSALIPLNEYKINLDKSLN